MELGSLPAGAFLTQPPHFDGDAVDVDAGVDAASQATLLLRRRKAVSDAEAELNARKAAFRERTAQLDERAARLAERRRALEDTAARFAGFVVENGLKADKAASRERAELLAAARLDAELERTAAEVARAQGELAAAGASNELLRRAADYLMQVKLASEGGGPCFEDARDIVSRHTALAASNRDLHAQAAAGEAALAELRQRHAALARSLQDRALQAACQQSQQAKALDAAEERIAAARARVDGDEAQRLAARLTWGQLQASLRNVYCRVVATAPPNSLGRLQGACT